MEDKLFVELLDKDSTEGMKMITKHFSESLYYTVGQRLKNNADIADCVTDTFEDFYLQRKNFDPEKGSLKAYLTTMADRKAIHRFHENNHLTLMDREEEIPAVSELERWEDRELVSEALNKLSSDDRKIVELRYYGGYSLKEIANMLGIKYETVKKRLQRAYKKLRTML